MTATNRTVQALLVHSDVGMLSALQTCLSAHGMRCVVARDLPTALLSVTQHAFDVCIVSSRLGEEGAGWPLAGVLHMVFPWAFVAVIAPETSVATLQAAINHGVNAVYEPTENVEALASEIVGAVMASQAGSSGAPVN
jgi:DNA-binding NtrC family response regulator